MEPNMKLLIEELMKEICSEIQLLRKEMKDGFAEIATHEVTTHPTSRRSLLQQSSTRSASLH
jgi:hypothetical protein